MVEETPDDCHATSHTRIVEQAPVRRGAKSPQTRPIALFEELPNHRTASVTTPFRVPRRNALRFARTYSSSTTQLGQPIGSPTSVPERRNAEPCHRVAAARVPALAARAHCKGGWG